jgi:phage/conjugal plasmid C-4 type zinc finger TraR family protein
MAGGWTRDGAIQDQIDDTVSDAVEHARSAILTGPSAEFCVECGEEIPERRRRAVAGVQTCILCQSERDGKRAASGFNRRGSKDSQLK